MGICEEEGSVHGSVAGAASVFNICGIFPFGWQVVVGDPFSFPCKGNLKGRSRISSPAKVWGLILMWGTCGVEINSWNALWVCRFPKDSACATRNSSGFVTLMIVWIEILNKERRWGKRERDREEGKKERRKGRWIKGSLTWAKLAR